MRPQQQQQQRHALTFVVLVVAINAIIAAVPLAAGTAVGRLVSGHRDDGGGGGWYADLNKPAYTPPSIVYAVVWPVLYVCLGLAVFFPAVALSLSSFVKDVGGGKKKCSLWVLFALYGLLAVHLVPNLSFTVLLFRQRDLKAAALAAWVALFSAIALFLLTATSAYLDHAGFVAGLASLRIAARIASWLLVPYLMWLAFASVLATHIYFLNAERKKTTGEEGFVDLASYSPLCDECERTTRHADCTECPRAKLMQLYATPPYCS